MTIIKYIDPILKQKCVEINLETELGLASSIISEMKKTLSESSNGVGLAAPQVGYDKRIILIRVKKDNEINIKAIINPVMVSQCGNREIASEGCLSYPGIYRMIPRYTEYTIKGYTENGKEVEFELKNFEARIAQHEMDHLDGHCKVDDKSYKVFIPNDYKNKSKKLRFR